MSDNRHNLRDPINGQFMEVDKHPFDAPRSAIGLSLVLAIVAVFGVIRPEFHWPLIAFCYIAIIGIAWLCRSEIGHLRRTIHARKFSWGFLRRDFWLLVFLFIAGSLMTGFLTIGEIQRSLAASAPTLSRENPFDNKISVDCYPSAAPDKMEDERPILFIQINSFDKEQGDKNKDIFNIVNGYFIQSVSPINWENYPPPSAKCLIINYGEHPVFGLTLSFFIDWREVVQNVNGWSSGASLRTALHQSQKFDIGTGSNNSEYFYIFNMSDYVTVIRILDNAMVVVRGSRTEKQIKLIPRDEDLLKRSWFSLNPRRLMPNTTNPLRQSPPAR